MDDKLKKAKKVIENGGIVIYPTETAYGIAADATNEEAIEKVYQAKNRPKEKGITTIVKNLEQAKKYGNISEKEEKIIEEFMPGPLTLITSKKESSTLPDNLNKDFVFRISSSKTARELASKTPITATSANISGKNTSYSIESISDKLKNKVDYIIDEGVLDPQPTSTIARIENKNIKIYREGPIAKKELEKVL